MAQIGSYPLVTTLTGFVFAGVQGGDSVTMTIAQLDARYGGGTSALLRANNLSDLTSVPTARTNLGLGTAALVATTTLLLVANNLSDLANASTARTNLGLGSLATLSTINDSNWSGTALAITHGGTGATSASAARTALGLGSLATASTVDNTVWSGTQLSIANGGTGQTSATTAFGALSPLTTKGDLLGYDSGANVRVGVGANGTVLTAASGSTAGWTWSTPANAAAQFVVATSDASLPNAKVLTAASGISITSGATIGVATSSVTNAMLATVSTATFKGRTTAGTGAVEDLTATQATALLNAFGGDSGSGGLKGAVPAPSAGDAAANKVLGAGGTWVAQSGSGGAPVDAQYLTLAVNATLTVERVFTPSAELTGTDAGAGSTYTLGITTNGVTLAMMAQVATARFLGRTTAATGNVEALTGTQATALLDNLVGDSGSGGTKGLVPAPASGDAAAGKFLKADGTWAVPTGGSITLSSTNAWTGVNSFTIADAATNTVTTTLTLAHTTSGTAAANFGNGLLFQAESAGGTLRSGMRLDAILATATDAAENFDFSVKLMAAGAAVAEKFKVTSAGIASAGGTNLMKESRTIAVGGGVTIDGATSTLDLSANRTIGFSANVLSLITPDPAADKVPFWDASGAVMGYCLMQDVRGTESWTLALDAENTTNTVTTKSYVFRAPYAFVCTDIRLMVRVHGTSGTISAIIAKSPASVSATTTTGGTSICSTFPALPTTTLTSVSGGGTPAVLNASANFTSDEVVAVTLSYAATGIAAGAKLEFIGYRN